MTEHSEQPADAWLAERHEALASELLKALRDRIPLYRDLPDEQLRLGATTFVRHFVACLRTGDTEALLDIAARNIERRYAQGLGFEAGITFTAPLRQAFFTVLGPAVELPVKGVHELLLRAERIFERLDMVASRFLWGELRRAEQAREESKRQEEQLRAQEALLRELSTPLIPVSDDVVVMPVVGALTEARAGQMRGALLDGITAHRARVAILDVTGVPCVDGKVAEALLYAVRSARLLGAEVVLSGIKPAAAQALVRIGADFSGIVTRATLKDGIAHALRKA